MVRRCWNIEQGGGNWGTGLRYIGIVYTNFTLRLGVSRFVCALCAFMANMSNDFDINAECFRLCHFEEGTRVTTAQPRHIAKKVHVIPEGRGDISRGHLLVCLWMLQSLRECDPARNNCWSSMHLRPGSWPQVCIRREQATAGLFYEVHLPL